MFSYLKKIAVAICKHLLSLAFSFFWFVLFSLLHRQRKKMNKESYTFNTILKDKNEFSMHKY